MFRKLTPFPPYDRYVFDWKYHHILIYVYQYRPANVRVTLPHGASLEVRADELSGQAKLVNFFGPEVAQEILTRFLYV